MAGNGFKGASLEQHLDFQNTITLESYAFSDIKTLSGLTMKSGTIGHNAFSGCSGLKYANLGDQVTSIGSYAFDGCAGLTYLEIPDSVTYYGENMIRGCVGITELHLGRNAPVGVDFTDSSYCNGGHPLYIGSGSHLQKLFLSDEITAIGQYAFANRRYYSIISRFVDDGFPELSYVKLPSKLTRIGNNAFYLANKIAAVYSGPELSSIGSNAFKSTGTTFYALPDSGRNEWLAAWCGSNGYTYISDAMPLISVYFDVNDEKEGDEAPVIAADIMEVDAFGLIEEPPVPVREGYIFLGWYAPGSSIPWNFATDHAGAFDLTLSARWMEETLNGYYRIEGDHAVLISYSLSELDPTYVALPDNWKGYPVTRIADGAFAGEPVTSLLLPAFVSNLSASTFAGADDLCWIGTPGNCVNYSSKEGLLYDADGTTLIYYPPSYGTKDMIVPDGVTAIGDYAFYGCDSLETLSLPDSLLRIGAGAFQECGNLQKAEGAANCVTVGNNAFAYTGFCIFYGEESSALIQYAIANNRPYNVYTVHYILDGQEAEVRKEQAGEPITAIELTAPEGKAIKKVWYTDEDLTSDWQFESMLMPFADLTLYTVTIPEFEVEEYTPETLQEGEDDAIAPGLRIVLYNGSENKISIPDTINGTPVCTLDASAFPEGCMLWLPGNLLELDADAFMQRSITLYAPAGSATEQLLTAAGYQLQMPVRSLTFETNGGALVDEMQIQAGSVVTLPGTQRDGCSFGGWYKNSGMSELAGLPGEEFSMPDQDLTLYAAWNGEMPQYPFLWEQKENMIVVTGSKGEARVEIPDRINGLPVAEIGESAFFADSSLNEVILPSGLEVIGSFAFYGTGLKSISVPETTGTIGKYAFASCREMNDFSWSPASGSFSEGMLSGNTSLKSLTIHDGISGIETRALENCTGVTSLVIPDSVLEIGSGSLRGMTSLKTVTLGQNVSSISNTALDGCTALNAIIVDPENTHYVNNEGVLYYSDMSGIVKYPAGLAEESYVVHENAILVEGHAFADANNLKNLALPDGIMQIGEGAFAGCGITDLDLSALSELSGLYEEAFAGCSRLTWVTLPENVTFIGGKAFRGCYNLDSLDIPDMVTSIGMNAFENNTLLIVGENTTGHSYAQANGLAFRIRGAERIPAESITTEKESLTLMRGKSYTLEVDVLPADTTDELHWESDDADVLQVDDGYIRPFGYGETDIIIWAGDVELRIPVRVVDHPFKIEQENGLVFTEDTVQLTARNITDNYQNASPVWSLSDWYSSENPAGALITPGGLLGAENTGLVTATVSAESGYSDSKSFFFVNRSTSLCLPAGLQAIDSEAFRGASGVSCVVVPDGTVSIGEYAFADCEALDYIWIPDSVSYISETAFEGSPGVTIVCHGGSTANEYAWVNGTDVLALY